MIETKNIHLEKIVPSERKSKRWVNKASCISRKPLLVGEICRHLSQGDHDKVADESDKRITQENTKGSSLDECSTRADDETRPDSATKLKNLDQ